MQLLLQNVRLSSTFDLWEPGSFQESGKKKYSCHFLIEKGSEKDKKVQKAIKQAASDFWGDKAETRLKKASAAGKINYLDGDLKEYEGYQGNMYISAKNEIRPTYLKGRTPITKEDGILYPGCYVNAIVNVYATTKEPKGVYFLLKGVQFLKDGESFSSEVAAKPEDFPEVTYDDEEKLF